MWTEENRGSLSGCKLGIEKYGLLTGSRYLQRYALPHQLSKISIFNRNFTLLRCCMQNYIKSKTMCFAYFLETKSTAPSVFMDIFETFKCFTDS